MPIGSPTTRRLRARPDLQFVLQEGAGGDRYAVKDPVSLEYFYLRRREYFLLRELAKPRTLRELRAAYLRRFPGERITHDELLAFCSMMHRCSLLMPEGPGQSRQIELRSTSASRGGAWFSPLAIRLPGFDPSPLLRPLSLIGRGLFSGVAAVLFAGIALLVGVLMLQQADRLAVELPRLVEFSRPGHLLAGLVALVLMKSWHEIGHGLAVRRFGGECHEMGVLLLVFLPCLYCDASDAWSFRSRWRRAVVALAGVYFELIAAVLAAALWLVLAPGVLASLALYAAVIGSAMTVLVNLNPLLRFDGYYLLADACGVANLHAESRRALWGPIARWVRGAGADRQPFDAPRWRLALFAAASGGHLIAVTVAILWAVHRGLDAAGFRFVGDALVGLAIAGMVLRLASTLVGSLRPRPFTPWWRPAVRGALLAGVVGVGGWWTLGWELEQSLRSACRLESTANAVMTAPAAGQLVRLVSYESHVPAGEPIARIVNTQQELDQLKLEEKEASVVAQLAGLRARAQRDATLFSEIALAETQLAETRRQLRMLRRRAERRVLRSPVGGVVSRPPPRGEMAGFDLAAQEHGLGWTGAALEPANAGCSVEPGDLLCVVAGEGLHAVVLLRESDSGLVEPGDRVRVALDRAPGERLHGTVVEIALASSDDRSARPGDTADVAIEDGLRDTLDADRTHRVLVQLDPLTGVAAVVAQHGAVGQARIVTGAETVAGRLLRWGRQAFHFQ